MNEETINFLRQELTAANEQLRIGNLLHAKLTDKKNDLELNWAAARSEIARLDRLLVCTSSENIRLREALEHVKKHMEVTLSRPEMSATWNIADRALK